MHRSGGDALADLQAFNTFAQRIDHAQGFAATDRRQGRLVAIQAAYGQQVVIVDRGKRGADAHLTGAGFGQGDIGDGKDGGGIAEGGIEGGAHGSIHELGMFTTSGDVRAVDKALVVQHGILRRIVAECAHHRILC